MNRALVMMWLAACSSGPETDCANGIDDDKDGLADAFDADCSGSGTDDTTDTTPTDAPFLFDGLDEATVMVDVSIAPRMLGNPITADNPYCDGVFNLCDCTLHLMGNGNFVEGVGPKALFFGEWYLDNSDCNPALLGAVWYEARGVKVYHTFNWNEDGSNLDSWVVHKTEEADEMVPELESPKDNQQFYVAQMTAPFDGSSADYTEVGSADDDQLTTYVTTVFAADFQ